MKKIVIVLLCFISIVLVGCEKKVNSEFKTKANDKYLLVDYDKKMSEYDFGRQISINTVSICSTKKNEDGIIVTDAKGANAFFEEYSDIFKHPFVVGNSFQKSKNSIFVIVSSKKFDPLHFAYSTSRYDKKQNLCILFLIKQIWVIFPNTSVFTKTQALKPILCQHMRVLVWMLYLRNSTKV
jgi:hypothetical protein